MHAAEQYNAHPFSREINSVLRGGGIQPIFIGVVRRTEMGLKTYIMYCTLIIIEI